MLCCACFVCKYCLLLNGLQAEGRIKELGDGVPDTSLDKIAMLEQQLAAEGREIDVLTAVLSSSSSSSSGGNSGSSGGSSGGGISSGGSSSGGGSGGGGGRSSSGVGASDSTATLAKLTEAERKVWQASGAAPAV